MTNTVTNILSHDEELALRKPIEDYVGKIQAEIDELREEGTNKVLEYSEEIEALKRDKIYTKSEKEARLSELNSKLQKAKEIEAKNKQPINEKIAVAEKYLKDNCVAYELRDIKLNNPSKKELDSFIKLSGKDIKSFFNFSGLVYKNLNLKDKLDNMSYDEKLDLLSGDGMLVKRPILVTKDKVFVGFKEKEWCEIIK